MEKIKSTELGKLIADRSEFLRVLAVSPRSKRELTELLDCSRSTIDRVLRSLADAYLIKYRDGKWYVTAVGVLAYRQQDEYASLLSDLADAAPILNVLPTETRIGEAFLADSTAHIADNSVPDAVFDLMLCSVREASVIRGLAPKALAGSATEFYEAAITDDSSALELVLTGDVFDQLYELNPQETRNALARPNVTLFRGAIPWIFGLWIADETQAGIVVYTEQGVQGCIQNDTEIAVEWARGQYESVKDDAEEIFLRGNPIEYSN